MFDWISVSLWYLLRLSTVGRTGHAKDLFDLFFVVDGRRSNTSVFFIRAVGGLRSFDSRL